MASAQKQAKRAKRAKAKAKEARATRNNTPKYAMAETTELGPKAYELFEKMKAAESRSRAEMLTVLIQDSLSLGSDDPTAVQRILIGLYDSWKNGDDSRLPQGWWEEESFLADYAQAAQNAGEERLIEAWFAEEPA
ncbi:hypothetical protein [Pseudomonas chlororaphis]|uniref:hypothetical protein n=1 Tax=Pseudomonas chlororaphis TaxID=587753 RepID=UPI000BE429BF|nr:hypothetical protein [Pseudomonas chlororaphis]